MRNLDDITEVSIDAAIQIHRELGPGLKERLHRVVNNLEPSASPRLRASA